MTTPILCPRCGEPMEEGTLNSRTPIFWSKDTSGLPLPTKRSDIFLGKAMGLIRPRAHICRDCQIVLTEY